MRIDLRNYRPELGRDRDDVRRGLATRYLGKVCAKHPELKGERQKRGSCVVCYYECKRTRYQNLHRTPEARAKQRAYRQTPERRAWIKEYHRNRRKSDLNYALRWSLSNRVRSAFKRQGVTKSIETMELLGCTEDYFRKHIERQFRHGMTRDNYGDWHIDHKIPCAAFDLTDPEQQLVCFNYRNLQPLWGPDNLSKGARLDWTANDVHA